MARAMRPEELYSQPNLRGTEMRGNVRYQAGTGSIAPEGWIPPPPQPPMRGGGGGGGARRGGGARAGGGRGGGGRGGGPYPSQQVTTELNLPPHERYTPLDPTGTRLYGQVGEMQEYGEGLMDPESAYFQELATGAQQRVGRAGAAAERAAALRGAYGGLGGGASPELLATQADIAQATREAEGQVMADLRLEAPRLGADIISATYGPEAQMMGMGEGSRQYGHGSAEGARRFGGEMALQQEQMAAQRAFQQRQFEEMQRQREHEMAMMRERMGGQWAMQQGAPPPWATGGAGVRGGSALATAGGGYRPPMAAGFRGGLMAARATG